MKPKNPQVPKTMRALSQTKYEKFREERRRLMQQGLQRRKNMKKGKY